MKMFAVMSDRASVNKAYNRLFSQYRRDILGTETDLHYLFCNAHFLLGLSNASESALRNIESGLGPLGRDNNAQFGRFQGSAESACARYVRTACDVLGPRGDEKSGCRMEWESICSEQFQKKSHVTSFRMNRFNNFFQGAAALYYHRHEIQDFLGNYKDKLNLKLQSVLFDCISKDLQNLARALGIIYFKITGPFWQLLQSETNYSDLYKTFSMCR